MSHSDDYCDKCKKRVGVPHVHCPNCDSAPIDHELRNHSLMWHDGDVHCIKCDAFVRYWDAG